MGRSSSLRSDGAGNDFPAEVTKAWEPATEAVEAHGLRRVVGRIGVVLSNDGGAFPQMVLPFRLFAGGPIGSGKQWLSWVHIADVVAAIRTFIEDPTTSGVYNICAANPITNKEFGKTIGKALWRPAFAPAPAFVMKLLFGEMSTLLLEGQRVLPQRLEQAGFDFQYTTAEAAVTALLS
ncbi:MAG: TIGR01777 family oxidoreductase [Chloroflexota bacterium]